MAEYRMPSLGAAMKDGRVVEWYVQPGDAVRRGDVVGVVDTSKGAIEMEIWEDAVVEAIVVAPGEKVPVGEVLLRLGPAGSGVAVEKATPEEAASGAGPPLRKEAAEPQGAATEEEAAVAPPVTSTQPERAGTARPGEGAARPAPAAIRASPAARRRAGELGVDLRQVEGSGPGGAVVLADVQAWATRSQGAGAERPGHGEEGAEPLAGPPARWPAGEVHATPLARKVAEDRAVALGAIAGTGPGGLVTRADVEAAGAGAAADSDRLAAMRQAVAGAMSRSKREIPHYYLGTAVSMLRATNWLRTENADRPPKGRILLVALYLKAVARAVREFPELNGYWLEDGFRPAEVVHPGLAISLRGGGLVAPAVHDADGRTLEELTTGITDLVGRARVGRLRSSEVTDATLTVSSMGDRGVERLYGVIYPPQVALVGVGRVVERPWAEDGLLGVRPVVDLTLSADHRASDGHRGGLFLARVGELLQEPEAL